MNTPKAEPAECSPPNAEETDIDTCIVNINKSHNYKTQNSIQDEDLIIDADFITPKKGEVSDVNSNNTKNTVKKLTSDQIVMASDGTATSSKADGKKAGARQFSQAQRNHRNSLANAQGGRPVATGKDRSANTRQGVMNSPMMQPPPQVLQSRIIIHLLRTEYPLIEQVAKQEMNWRVTKSENPNVEFDIYWNDIGVDSDRLASLKPYQKTNHFPAMYQITRKTCLARNLKRLQKLYPLEFDFFPRTWVVPNEMADLRSYALEVAKKPKGSPKKKPLQKTKGLDKTFQLPSRRSEPNSLRNSQGHDNLSKNGYAIKGDNTGKDVRQSKPTAAAPTPDDSSELEEEDKEDFPSSSSDSGEEPPARTPQPMNAAMNARDQAYRSTQPKFHAADKVRKFPMIVKPDCSSQGKGIFLTNDIDQIPRDDTYVVQEYMPNPYLIDGLKFDLRLYVLVLSCEPLKIFLYQEGLVRFATHKYVPLDSRSDKDALGNLYMHLTNYAINKENKDFKMAESMEDATSHKRTLATVLERLKGDGLDPDKIMGEIKDVIIKTLITIQHDLMHNYRTCQPADLESLMCFEILGFDIILDTKGRPLLLEVNQAPSFATDSPLDYEIKKGLFVDTFRLLDLSVEKKRAKLRRLYEEKKERMMTKLSLKQKHQQRSQAVKEFKKEQDIFEAANKGRFEKIYPLPVQDASESNQKTQENKKLDQTQKQLAQSQYQALSRQQERYAQLLATLSSNDVEKAVRVKNRQEEVKGKDEKQKEAKLRLKQTAKKRQEQQVAAARQKLEAGRKALQGKSPEPTPAQDGSSIDQSIQAPAVVKNLEASLETQSVDPKLRSSLADRIIDDSLKPESTADTRIQARRYDHKVTPAYPYASHVLENQSSSLQIGAHQYPTSVEDERQAGLREIISSAPHNQNYQLKQLIEMNRAAKAGPGRASQSNPTYQGNIFLQSQEMQSLSGRGSPSKKQQAIGEVAGNSQMIIDGLKPIVTQINYAGGLSQSQNPLSPPHAPYRLRSREVDKPQNRTTIQDKRQGNLLPTITRIPHEKSCQGFTNSPLQQSGHDTEPVIGSRHRNRETIGGHHSAAATQHNSRLALADAVTMVQQQQHQQQQVPIQLMNSMMSLNSPKPRRGVDRAHFYRSSVKQATGAKPLTLKTQQINLGSTNIQPVIIDSTYLGAEQQPITTAQTIPMGGGISYKTQKFSKIQLQTIMDNLFKVQQEAGIHTHPKSRQTVHNLHHANNSMLHSTTSESLGIRGYRQENGATPGLGREINSVAVANQELARTQNFKNIVHPSQLVHHLPEVSSFENIQKQASHIANRALNAIDAQRASTTLNKSPLITHPSQAIGGFLATQSSINEPGSPTSHNSSSAKLASSSATLKEQQQQASAQTEQSRFSKPRGRLHHFAHAAEISSPILRSNRSRKRFTVQGSAVQQEEPLGRPSQPMKAQALNQGTGDPVGQQAQPATTMTNVLNFNNCNVTIINNNVMGSTNSRNVFEQQPAEPSSPRTRLEPTTLVHTGLRGRSLQARHTKAKQSFDPSTQPLSQINEVSIASRKYLGEATPRGGDEN